MSDTGQRLGRAAARKRSLRARVLAARGALTGPVRATAAERVQATLRDLLAGTGGPPPGPRPGTPWPGAPPPGATRPAGGTVACYLPIGSEPGGRDLPAVLAGALSPGGRVLLPVLCPDLSLDWAVHDPAAGPGGARFATDPPGRRLGVAAIAEATLVVVPALAVDRRGVRLGRGGGSYDRALARAAPDAPVVALLYDGELLDEDLPREPHDRPVSAVITPALGLVPLPAGRLPGEPG
jgi:5-formyltetrahydrofolate cyclo-ligase